MIRSKKLGSQILIALLIMLLAAPAAFAGEQAQLIFNGQEYGNVSVKDGVSYISTATLAKIPGLSEVNDVEKEIAIRSFFEGQGGKVSWDGQKRQVQVSLNGKDTEDANDPSAELTADELVLKYTERLEEANSYKMKGESTIKFNIAGFEDVIDIPEFPEIDVSIEGTFQYDPMAMYMKQTMKLPFSEMGLELSPEELEELAEMGLGGDMVTEMVFLDNAIYQKTPMSDQWIVQDLSELGALGDIQNLMQITPQQSLDMLKNAGIVNTLGDDVVIEGKEYYTIKNFIDSKAFKTLLEEMLGEIDLIGMITASTGQAGLETEELAQFNETFEKVFEIILNNLQIQYYIDTLVSKDLVFPEYMNMDLDLQLDIKPVIEEIAKVEDIDTSDIPEGPMNISVKMTGDYQLSDFGTKLELPDLSKAISQEEFMKQFMEQMEKELEVEEPEATEVETGENVEETIEADDAKEIEEVEETEQIDDETEEAQLME